MSWPSNSPHLADKLTWSRREVDPSIALPRHADEAKDSVTLPLPADEVTLKTKTMDSPLRADESGKIEKHTEPDSLPPSADKVIRVPISASSGVTVALPLPTDKAFVFTGTITISLPREDHVSVTQSCTYS